MRPIRRSRRIPAGQAARPEFFFGKA